MNIKNQEKQPSVQHNGYTEILRDAVAAIEKTRTAIARHVNASVTSAYWEIGRLLHERKVESGYGDGIVKQLSSDLKERYPQMGVSMRQLWNMKKFYERYAGHDEKLLRSVALLPWSHNLLLLSKGMDDAATLYYPRNHQQRLEPRFAAQCHQNGYARGASLSANAQQLQPLTAYGTGQVCQRGVQQ